MAPFLNSACCQSYQFVHHLIDVWLKYICNDQPYFRYTYKIAPLQNVYVVTYEHVIEQKMMHGGFVKNGST